MAREGVMVKSGSRWDPRFAAGIHSLREKVRGGRVTGFGVFAGPRAMVMDDVHVLPWKAFLERLWDGLILA